MLLRERSAKAHYAPHSLAWIPTDQAEMVH